MLHTFKNKSLTLDMYGRLSGSISDCPFRLLNNLHQEVHFHFTCDISIQSNNRMLY